MYDNKNDGERVSEVCLHRGSSDCKEETHASVIILQATTLWSQVAFSTTCALGVVLGALCAGYGLPTLVVPVAGLLTLVAVVSHKL
jgi:hypothetical protein